MFGAQHQWVVSPPPAGPLCKILPNPTSDDYCGTVCLGGHTALDNAVCDECFEAVAHEDVGGCSGSTRGSGRG